MKFMYAFGVIVTSYILYKYKQKNSKLLLVHSHNRLSRLFRLLNQKYFESFRPSLFILNGHAQTMLLEICTILMRFFKKLFQLFNFSYKREIFTLSDGCKIAIDHAKNFKFSLKKRKENDNILIILPGVTSTSQDYYIKAIVEDFLNEYDCRVMNARGFGGIPLYSHHLISSNCYLDVQEYIEKVASDNPNKKIFAVGFSFGGMLLARYLGACEKTIPKNFMAGCGICYPYCLEETKNFAEVHFNGIYSKVSMESVRNTFLNNIDNIFAEKCDPKLIAEKETLIKQVSECQLMSHFDTIWTYRSLGLESVEEYYNTTRLHQYVKDIKVPFLSMFTEDDPIIPIDSIPFKILRENPNTVTVVSPHGGHIAFFGGLVVPQRTVDQPIKNFMKLVEILRDTKEENLTCA